MNRLRQGFSIIESICMLAAIVVFTLICVAIYRKQPDFFGMNQCQSPRLALVGSDQAIVVSAR